MKRVLLVAVLSLAAVVLVLPALPAGAASGHTVQPPGSAYGRS